MTTYLIFGDSITQGMHDREGGWTQRLRQDLQQAHPNEEVNVYNLGIAGNRVGDILARFELEAVARIEPGDEITIIIAVGANDAAVVRDSEQHWTPMPDFMQGLKEVAHRSKAITPQVLFVGLTPVDDSKVDPCPWFLSLAYRLREATEYDAAVKETAAKLDIIYVDIMKAFLANKAWPESLSDGLHPNEAGHELIANAVKEGILELENKKKERDAA